MQQKLNLTSLTLACSYTSYCCIALLTPRDVCSQDGTHACCRDETRVDSVGTAICLRVAHYQVSADQVNRKNARGVNKIGTKTVAEKPCLSRDMSALHRVTPRVALVPGRVARVTAMTQCDILGALGTGFVRLRLSAFTRHKEKGGGKPTITQAPHPLINRRDYVLATSSVE